MRAIWPCLIVSCGLGTCATAAEPPFPISVNRDERKEHDRYCGLYCVHQAGQITGRDVDLNRLIRPERIQGEFGSTAENLLACCREFGINCTYLPSTSYADVCLLGGPVIVLVKSGPEARKANHWVMILSANPASAEVYDPSVGAIRISAAELQSLWGGPAIIVLEPSDGPEVDVAWATAKIGLFCGIAALTLLVIRLLSRTRMHPALILVSSCIGLAAIAHVADPAGFARNPDVVKQIDKGRRPRTPERISPVELLNTKAPVLIVDARTLPQYEASRIPGAVSLPITTAPRLNKRKLAEVSFNTRIVLYCNSENCPWAEMLAKSSLFQDYESVFILDGGIDGYKAAGGNIAFGHPRTSETK